MKKLFSIFIIVVLGLGFLSTSSFAYPGKGNRIFLKKLRVPCGYSGFVMAKKHTQAEWIKIFKSGKLNETMKSYCPNAKDFKTSEEKHVTDFLYAFASDSGKIAVGC